MRILEKSLLFRVGFVLLVLILLVFSGVFSLRYYYVTLKPQMQREKIMKNVERLSNSINPVSGDILILGEQYGSNYSDIIEKETFSPIEEADIERGIIAYGKKERGQILIAYYFDALGKLIGGKTRQYSYSELANFFIERWGKGEPPLRYNDYDIHVNENNGRIYLIATSSLRSNNASLIMVGKSSAVFLLNYLFDKNLVW